MNQTSMTETEYTTEITRGEGSTLWRLVVAHLYVGVPIVAIYIALAPYAIERGYPSLIVLLLCELTIMPLLIIGHLYAAGYRLNGRLSLQGVIGWGSSTGLRRFSLQVLGCVILIIMLYGPSYMVGAWLREAVFTWLPDWYFDPGFDQAAQRLLVLTVLLAIISDGIVAPVLEEIYFRGYLLPRMKEMGWLAPVLNSALFTLYHFWQPHNYLGIFFVSLVISFAVWKTGNLRLGIAIHCCLNLMSSLGLLGYLVS